MFGPPTAKTAARGYGKPHQRLRAQWAPKVAMGQVRCWRCGYYIQPGEAWDLGHDDQDRTVYRGPEHRHRTAHCKGNRLAGLIKAANNNKKRRKGLKVETPVVVAIPNLKPQPNAVRRQRNPHLCPDCGTPTQRKRCFACVPANPGGHDGKQMTREQREQRARQAVTMRHDGVEWQTIATELGYSNGGSAYNSALPYLRPATADRW